MPSHPGKGHAFPYFKVQVRDERTLAWKDARKNAFEDEPAARAFQAGLSPSVTSRVMRWDVAGATPLEN